MSLADYQARRYRSAQELVRYYELSHEREVPIFRYVIEGESTDVGPGKYLSALLLYYLKEMAGLAVKRDTGKWMFGHDVVFTVTRKMKETIRRYFGEELCSDAEKPTTRHRTIRLLLFSVKEPTVRLHLFDESRLGEMILTCWNARDSFGSEFPGLPVGFEWAREKYDIFSVKEMARRVSEFVFVLSDRGAYRAAKPGTGGWTVNEAFKPAILLYFLTHDNVSMGEGAFDKVPLKFADYTEERFRTEGLCIVPTAFARRGSYLGPGTVMMNHAGINSGAFFEGDGMIDSDTLVGSCAQVGRKVHLSMHVGVGGVLEPAGARPVIVEDQVFLGASVQLVEGFLARRGSIFGAGGVYTASTPIQDPVSGKTYYGEVPEYAVVVPGVILKEGSNYGLNGGIIKKYVDERTREKTKPEAILHEAGATA